MNTLGKVWMQTRSVSCCGYGSLDERLMLLTDCQDQPQMPFYWRAREDARIAGCEVKREKGDPISGAESFRSTADIDLEIRMVVPMVWRTLSILFFRFDSSFLVAVSVMGGISTVKCVILLTGLLALLALLSFWRDSPLGGCLS